MEVADWNELAGKREQFAMHGSRYLNTAMAGELGTETTFASMSRYISPANNPFWGTEKGRLSHLPGSVKEALDGTIDLRDLNKGDRVPAGEGP